MRGSSPRPGPLLEPAVALRQSVHIDGMGVGSIPAGWLGLAYLRWLEGVIGDDASIAKSRVRVPPPAL